MQLIKMSKSLLRMIVLADGEEYESRGASITGFDDLAENGRNAVIAATGYPESLLFGKSTSGLATAPGIEQEGYSRQVGDRQEQRIEPAAHEMLNFIAAAKSGPIHEAYYDFEIEFNPLIPESQKDKAARQVTTAQRDAQLVGALGKLDSRAAKSLIRHIVSNRYTEHGYQDELPGWEIPPDDGTVPSAGGGDNGGGNPFEDKPIEGLPGVDLQFNNTGKEKFA
jgi:hypothetical protein